MPIDEKELSTTIEQAVSYEVVVRDAEEFRLAGDVCKDISATEKMVKDYWSPLKTTAHKSWKDLCDREAMMLKPLTEKKAALKASMKAWMDAEEAARVAAMAQVSHEAEVGGGVPEVPVVAVPKGYGQFTRAAWRAEVFDVKVLVKAVCNGEAPIEAVVPNESWLNARARELKNDFSFPGVRSVKE